MSRICLYYRPLPEIDRWIPMDRYFRPWVRRLVRGRPRMGGIDKVFANLCLGLDSLGVDYLVNLPFSKLKDGDRIGVLGCGRWVLEGYTAQLPIVGGIGLMSYPSEWPSLCQDYPVAIYLQHCDWANEIYKPFFGKRCRTWAVGIDTDAWRPSESARATYDFLIYDKITWERSRRVPELLRPIEDKLSRLGLSFTTLRYGGYTEAQYHEALASCHAMIFLCEHETQGLAYLEALASGIPILAWDQGEYLDPHRFEWSAAHIPATSVPFFDARCGQKFAHIDDFGIALDRFLVGQERNAYTPRDFVLENLTLEKCAKHFLELLEEAQTYVPDRSDAANCRVITIGSESKVL